jgi:hypothetical protein
VPDARLYVDAKMYAESLVGGPLLWPRKHRDGLIKATDWVDENPSRRQREPAEFVAAIEGYRQALFDLPETCPDPMNIVWPEMPTKLQR